MLNFGLTELRLVAPRDGWPNPDAGPGRAAPTSCSNRPQSSPPWRRRSPIARCLSPRPCAAATSSCRWSAPRRWPRHPRLAGRSAILFGPERSGLETEDVALATTIVTVPINPEFGSLNLAQAVILLAYEWSKRQRRWRSPRSRTGTARSARRTRGPDRPARRRARTPRLFPSRPSGPGHPPHDPLDPDQAALVEPRGQGGPRHDSRAGQPRPRGTLCLPNDGPSQRCRPRNRYFRLIWLEKFMRLLLAASLIAAARWRRGRDAQ